MLEDSVKTDFIGPLNERTVMLHSQDSFQELEEVLRSLQEHCGPTDKASSTDHTKSLSRGKDENGEKHNERKAMQEIPVIKVEYCNELSIEEVLMEILLRQQLHTSKEYTLNGLSFKVYVLDDTEL